MLLKQRESWKNTSRRLWSATRKVFLKRIETVKKFLAFCFLAIVLFSLFLPELRAQGIAISYPGLTGESASLWMASDGGFFKENGIDAIIGAAHQPAEPILHRSLSGKGRPAEWATPTTFLP